MKKALLFLTIGLICATYYVVSQEPQEQVLEALEEIEKKEETKEAEPLETQAKARALLNEVIKLHTLFNTKMAASEFADFISGNLNRWRQTKNLKIPESTSWNKFKFDLDQLGSQLALIQTDQHFLNELRKNHEAYKAVQQLKTNLQKIYDLPVRLKRVSFIPLLNTYAQQLYSNKLLEKTNDILKVAIKEKVEPQQLEPDTSFFDDSTIFDDLPPIEDYSTSSLDFEDSLDSYSGGDFDFDFDFDF